MRFEMHLASGGRLDRLLRALEAGWRRRRRR